ncbi:hypothetical protein FEE95_04225 [Maribacter algarum]|uniref:WG containing repeat-containing protein n=1 Tax=Maribacter algarum (ex Zhang et al. 2020) TaxID=2578118 RepID=A0A5S3PUH8_9FLAO|nr:hypothetical protein [Maribacter algarum]TMM58645.1 hypothetical protein FEE95_04225 [Maribacter algarum]
MHLKNTTLTITLFFLCWYTASSQNTFSVHDYYPIADQNEWRYTAPEGWKDGDYVSKIVAIPKGFLSLFDSIQNEDGKGLFQIAKNAKTFRHYDATKASKLLSVGENGILYHGETFSSDGSIAVFEKPIHWFAPIETVGDTLNAERNYIRFFKDGRKQKGIFSITQQISRTEDVIVPSGNYKDCLRIEFDTYWDLGRGTEAKSINVYHHAKNVGVVKASARFIILKNGNEIINRLVAPDLKSYKIQEDSNDVILPIIERIKMATVVVKDIKTTKKLYTGWLDYKLADEGKISKEMANGWGTPKMNEKPFALLQPKSGDDVYLRVVEGTVPKDYKAMTTYGWNAIELIVENPDEVYEKLSKSPFVHIGGPENLGDGLSSIRAVQFKGPSGEVFYFTADMGHNEESTLLKARSAIDRPFIMVAAGPDARVMTDFYVNIFNAKEAFFMETPIPLIASAQNLTKDYKFALGLVRLGAFSNSIEIDGYSENAKLRGTEEGELPPGVSMASFTVSNLDLIDSSLFINSPIILPGLGYDGNRMVIVKGPAGEFIELIEEKKN